MLGVLKRTEAAFDSVFGTHWNPWYQLGALSFHFFWIVVVSGVYLYVFFDTSILGAYASVQALTEEQWYLGGVMRSLHRYASDAMVVTVTLHLLREFAKGRFRGAQTFSWVSGLPLLWLLFAAGIGGYWLVWDQFAQYVAQTTTEWLERLPAISDSLARTFLSDATLSDRLFSLLVFMHIAIPLFLLVGMFIHVNRLKLARTQPANGLAIGVVMMLVLLSLVKPARSMGPADLKTAVASVDLDWFYMNFYPLLDRMDPLYVWIMLAGITGLLMLLPWLSPQKTPAPLAAVVDPNELQRLQLVLPGLPLRSDHDDPARVQEGTAPGAGRPGPVHRLRHLRRILPFGHAVPSCRGTGIGHRDPGLPDRSPARGSRGKARDAERRQRA